MVRSSYQSMREGENIPFFIAFSSLFILCLPGRTDALHTWCLTGRAALPFRTLAPSVHPSTRPASLWQGRFIIIVRE